MTLTKGDYSLAVDRAVQVLRSLGEDLVCVYLYGSAARDEHRPGSSDADIAVFLRDGVWEDPQRSLEVLSILEKAGGELVRAGIPYEGIACWTEDEVCYIPFSLRAQFYDGRETRLLAGSPLRPEMESALPASRGLHEMDYLALFPFATYLATEELSEQQCVEVAGCLGVIRKVVPQMACAVAGVPAAKKETSAVLAGLFPGMDLSILGELESLRASGVIPPPAEARRLLKESLELLEDLEREIDARQRPRER